MKTTYTCTSVYLYVTFPRYLEREGGRERGREGEREGEREGAREGRVDMIIPRFLLSLVMGIRSRLLIDLEEVSKVVQGKMSFHILFFVHYAAAESLLVCLTLENLFLY